MNDTCPTLRFAKDWNKLSGSQFTTIRRDDRKSYRVGRIYHCITPTQEFYTKIVSIHHLHKYDIDDEFASKDCDTNRWGLIALLEKIYGRNQLTFLVLTLNKLPAPKTIPKSKETQQNGKTHKKT